MHAFEDRVPEHSMASWLPQRIGIIESDHRWHYSNLEAALEIFGRSDRETEPERFDFYLPPLWETIEWQKDEA